MSAMASACSLTEGFLASQSAISESASSIGDLASDGPEMIGTLPSSGPALEPVLHDGEAPAKVEAPPVPPCSNPPHEHLHFLSSVLAPAHRPVCAISCSAGRSQAEAKLSSSAGPRCGYTLIAAPETCT